MEDAEKNNNLKQLLRERMQALLKTSTGDQTDSSSSIIHSALHQFISVKKESSAESATNSKLSDDNLVPKPSQEHSSSHTSSLLATNKPKLQDEIRASSKETTKLKSSSSREKKRPSRESRHEQREAIKSSRKKERHRSVSDKSRGERRSKEVRRSASRSKSSHHNHSSVKRYHLLLLVL